MIKEYSVDPTEEHKKLIEWALVEQQLPLYPFYSDVADGENNTNPVFAHTFRRRDDKRRKAWGVKNSDHMESFENIFKDFCSKNNIKVNKIFRSAINFTTHQPDDNVNFIHKDHDFPHHSFLMYLNDFDDGPTYFYDDDEKLIYKSVPKKYNAIISDGEKHTQGYCAPHQMRVVLVVTYE